MPSVVVVILRRTFRRRVAPGTVAVAAVGADAEPVLRAGSEAVDGATGGRIGVAISPRAFGGGGPLGFVEARAIDRVPRKVRGPLEIAISGVEIHGGGQRADGAACFAAQIPPDGNERGAILGDAFGRRGEDAMLVHKGRPRFVAQELQARHFAHRRVVIGARLPEGRQRAVEGGDLILDARVGGFARHVRVDFGALFDQRREGDP